MFQVSYSILYKITISRNLLQRFILLFIYSVKFLSVFFKVQCRFFLKKFVITTNFIIWFHILFLFRFLNIWFKLLYLFMKNLATCFYLFYFYKLCQISEILLINFWSTLQFEEIFSPFLRNSGKWLNHFFLFCILERIFERFVIIF